MSVFRHIMNERHVFDATQMVDYTVAKLSNIFKLILNYNDATIPKKVYNTNIHRNPLFTHQHALITATHSTLLHKLQRPFKICPREEYDGCIIVI